MGKMVMLVARDAAPSGCFNRLQSVLRERGFLCLSAIGEGKPLAVSGAEISELIVDVGADVVLLGMSSSAELAAPELAAGRAAIANHVPFGFYGDVPRCWARARPGAWFAELAADTAFYCGITQADADAAREVFPKARLIGTGNPLREEMAFPSFTREEVREMLSVTDQECLILAPGNKFAAGNLASWVVLMEALERLTLGKGFRLILAPHPGDRTPYALDSSTQKAMQLYEELAAVSPVPTQVSTGLRTSTLVPGADLIVEFGSSIGIEAAYQGVPVISLGFEVLFRRLEQASGTRELEAVENGLSELVEAEAHQLAVAIRRLLTPEGFAPMRERQQELCPKPTERGAALRRIADVIAEIAGAAE